MMSSFVHSEPVVESIDNINGIPQEKFERTTFTHEIQPFYT